MVVRVFSWVKGLKAPYHAARTCVCMSGTCTAVFGLDGSEPNVLSMYDTPFPCQVTLLRGNWPSSRLPVGNRVLEFELLTCFMCSCTHCPRDALCRRLKLGRKGEMHALLTWCRGSARVEYIVSSNIDIQVEISKNIRRSYLRTRVHTWKVKSVSQGLETRNVPWNKTHD